MTINYLFVYGTLKPGGEAHFFDQNFGIHGVMLIVMAIGSRILILDIQ